MEDSSKKIKYIINMEDPAKKMTDYDKDLFIKQLTYLPFKDVISLCQSNSKFHRYCTNYNNSWKSLIDDTFSDIPNYEDKLNKIWLDLNYENGKYDYIVYTQLINYLDPITQLMIYYKQKDYESFENKKFDKDDKIYRFLALFLLGEKDKIMNYLPTKQYLIFVRMLNGDQIDNDVLNNMLGEMAARGNLLGVKLFLSKGADIHNLWALTFAIIEGQLEIIKYLIENGDNIHAQNDYALKLASQNGHLEVVKYLVENGANIHAQNDDALIGASQKGHLEVVKYLVENGANIHAGYDEALRWAKRNKHIDVVKYLQSLNI